MFPHFDIRVTLFKGIPCGGYNFVVAAPQSRSEINFLTVTNPISKIVPHKKFSKSQLLSCGKKNQYDHTAPLILGDSWKSSPHRQ